MVDEGNRRERVADILAEAQKIVLVDGKPHRACPEPGWMVVRNFRESAIWAMSDLAERHHDQRYRADRMAAALDEASWEGGDVDVLGSIEVLIPEAVRARWGDAHLIAVAAEYCEEPDYLRDMPVDRLADWGRARDALRACAGGGVVDEEMARCIPPLIEAMRAADCGFAADNIQAAFDVWAGERLDVDGAVPGLDQAPAPALGGRK